MNLLIQTAKQVDTNRHVKRLNAVKPLIQAMYMVFTGVQLFMVCDLFSPSIFSCHLVVQYSNSLCLISLSTFRNVFPENSK